MASTEALEHTLHGDGHRHLLADGEELGKKEDSLLEQHGVEFIFPCRLAENKYIVIGVHLFTVIVQQNWPHKTVGLMFQQKKKKLQQ
ncbi:hypothetical protein ACJX0J_013896, partial [Zea mays]